jgi:hypothetical protein
MVINQQIKKELNYYIKKRKKNLNKIINIFINWKIK